MRKPFWLNTEAEAIEDKAVIVQKVFNWYTIDRLGVRAIAINLNSEGVAIPSGDGQWSSVQISRLIKDSRVIGLYKQDKVLPEIITPLQFRQANDIINNAKTTGRRGMEWSSALRGIITCKHCGTSLKTQTSGENSRTLYCRQSMEGTCGAKGGIDYKLALLFAVWECHLVIAGNVGNEKVDKQDYSPQVAATQKEIDYLVELGSLAGGVQEIADKLQVLTNQKKELTRLQAAQTLNTDQDVFIALTHWLYDEMPDTVAGALEGNPKDSSVLNQRLHEAGQRITWNGQVLQSEKHTARKEDKRLIIDGQGSIDLVEEGTTELGGGWWFLSNPSAKD